MTTAPQMSFQMMFDFMTRNSVFTISTEGTNIGWQVTYENGQVTLPDRPEDVQMPLSFWAPLQDLLLEWTEFLEEKSMPPIQKRTLFFTEEETESTLQHILTLSGKPLLTLCFDSSSQMVHFPPRKALTLEWIDWVSFMEHSQRFKNLALHFE